MERRIIDEKSFPSNLEDRLASISNAINTELKIATLLHLDDSPREAREIKARVRETIGRGYLPKTETFMAYGNTLHDIALVAKETVVRDTGKIAYIGYSLTEAGKRYGRPATVLSLQYSVDNNISMFQILGSILTGGDSRSPYNRMRILRELKERGQLREVDLVEIIGSNNSIIQKHLIALAKIGFVTFDSIGAKQKGKFTYQWIPGKSHDNVETIGRQVTLTKRVADYLAQHNKEIECHTLSKVLEYKYPEHISKILSGLVKQGCVGRTSSWKAGELKSIAKILDKGRKWHDESYLPSVEILSDHSLDKYQEKVQTFEESEQFSGYIGRGIELYRSVSPNINSKSSQERKEEIKLLISNNHGLTTREIAERLRVSRPLVTYYTSQLPEIRQGKEGSEVRYFIDDNI